MLPDMDGFDCHQAACAAAVARIPVVFLTARDATEDKIRGLTLGGDDYGHQARSALEEVNRPDPRPCSAGRAGDGVEPTPRLTFADP